MRKPTWVDVVGAALALGLLGACGGIASQSGGNEGGTSSGEGSEGTKPVAGSPTCASPPCPVSASTPAASGPPSPMCTAHPCVNPTPIIVGDADTGYDTCAGGFLRRRVKLDACPSLLPRAATSCPPVGDAGGACTKDSDCIEHPFGLCGKPSAATADTLCECGYGCVRDSDCPGNTACICSDPVGYCPVGFTGCTSGEDCQPGCECVGARRSAGTDFQCQTPQDTCVTDADCADAGGCGCLRGGDRRTGTALSCAPYGSCGQ